MGGVKTQHLFFASILYAPYGGPKGGRPSGRNVRLNANHRGGKPKGAPPVVMDNPNFYLSLPQPLLHHGPSALRIAFYATLTQY